MVKRILLILFTIVLLLLGSCSLYFFLPPTLKAEWDMSPDKRIIKVWFRGEVDYNHIPNVQLWGDGHIVWVKYNASSKRQVLEGYLSKEEMIELINKLIEVGFFEGYSRFNYFNLNVPGGNILEVTLLNINHQVTIDPSTDYNNQDVLDLVYFLRNGAGVAGTEFVPKSGILHAFPIEEIDDYPDDAKADYEWLDENFGYSLEAVYGNKPHNGRKITGEELEFAWEIVNSPKPLVKSEGKVYWIAIVIPKIGLGF
jgi:hypothetical protein